ncbi:MAG: tRNA 2-thiocytidine biosynthesis protein TtcA [Ruminococcus sp.]|nr:tRNA 2-thiocytidine biosynthesis protein TtcA [Ruminococcus sp.]
MARELQPYQLIERSIIKRFRKDIWNKFVMGIKEYKMINDGDRIAVCISGGKDSMLLAKCMQHLQRYSPTDFSLEFICMDPGYNDSNRRRIEENAELMNIPIRFFDTRIFGIVANQKQNPCYLCARMRRGHLYAFARDLGCNKIALGHHFDDVIETILMGMIYGGQVQTMMPKLHSRNFKGMELIRPLYMVREEHIKQWVNYNALEFIACACRLTERLAETEDKGSISKRQEIKQLIAGLAKNNDFVETNIFKSVYNVNLRTVIEYEYKGKRYNFLDKYDEFDWEQDRLEQGLDASEDEVE